MIKKLGGSFLAIFFCSFPISAYAESTILVKWTFSSSANDYTLADSVSIFDNLTQRIRAIGTNEPTLLNNDVLSASKWTNEISEKYWLIPFSSLGYQDVTLSFEISGSQFGPRDFTVEYRLGENGEWRSVPEAPFITVTANNEVKTLSLPETTADQPAVFVRLLFTNNNIAVNGGALDYRGTSRLDDIFVKGEPIEDPEEEEPTDLLCTGAKENIILTEILPAPQSGNEYAELYNSGSECVNLINWYFTDGGNHRIPILENTIIEGDSYLTFFRNFYLNNSGDTLTIFDNNNEERSSTTYLSSLPGYSYSFNGSEWLFSSFQTPGVENVFDEIREEELAEAGYGVILNEVFPNPLSDEGANEFIELKNLDAEEKNLKDWSLVDASQKIFTFEEDTLIAPRGLLSLSRSSFGFSLNNTGTETLALLDPQGNTLSEIEYSGSQEDFSYSFDGNEWRWTKKVTPGEENQFSKLPKISLDSSTTGYADIPLTFKANIKNAKGPYRYSWDFGDGRRSTLREPKHLYEKTGEYKGSVTIRMKDGSAEKEFTITIKKYPSYAVLITALHPNPPGKDTGAEWLEIQNMSRKAIDLTGWKIATGTEDLINHPLAPGLLLESGKTLRLTRTHAAFALSNTAGIVELRYPNNEPASRTEYSEQEIPEGSTCINRNGRCDFTDKPNKKSTADEVKKENEKLVEKAPVNPPSEEHLNSPQAYPTKKEILARMGDDFNLLMNQLFLDALWKP